MAINEEIPILRHDRRRREWSKLLLGAVLSVALAVATGRTEASQNATRNVILIVLDDLNVWPTMDGRPGDPYAGEVATPNLDRLADQGHLFTSAFAAVAYCSPSRAAFLTGQTPFETHVLDNSAPWQSLVDPRKTLPAVMKSAGFKVGLFGKIFHEELTDEFKAVVADDYQRNMKNWSDEHGLPYGAGPGDFADAEHGDYANTTAAIDFINEHRSQPFFLALGLFKPHWPWIVPGEYFDGYPLPDVTTPASAPDDLADVPALAQTLVRAQHRYFENVQADGRWPDVVQGYLASITFADAMIGRLLDAMDPDLRANTAIVVVSDNGYHLGEKGVFHKWTLWDEAARVPMIIADPAHPGPKTVGALVQLPDIFPTILNLVNVPTPAWVRATSLLPQLENSERPSGRPAMVSMFDSILARTTTTAYIRHADGSEELYDLAADPREITNVAQSPSYAARKAGLALQVERYAAARMLLLSHADGERLAGSPDRNVLSGGHAATLAGGRGNDLYVVHHPGAVVEEASGGGVDTVVALTSFALPANVENLEVPERASGITVHGNAQNNRIIVKGSNVVAYDGPGLDTIEAAAGTRIVLEAGDNALDSVDGPVIVDLSRFPQQAACSFADGVLRVGGERVARFKGAFSIARDVINGCGAAAAAKAAIERPSEP